VTPPPRSRLPVHRRTGFQLVVAFALLVLGTWSQTGITGQDEYWLSFRTPLEMLERDSWWTPWVNGELRLRKPPLLYWLMAIDYTVFGPSYWSARLWCILAGVGVVWVTRALSQAVRDDGEPGDLAGWLALASAGVAVESRRAMFDLPVAFFAALTVLCLVRWARPASATTGGRAGWAIGAAVAAGLGFMTKGPVILLFVGTAVAAALCTAGRVRERLRGQIAVLVLAAAVFAAIALPWFVSVHLLHPEFGEVMAEEARSRRFGLHLKSLGPVAGGLLLNVFPWSFALVAALVAAFRGRSPTPRRARWLLLWVALSVVPFLFMKTFERYLIPLAVPGCVFVAHYLDRHGPAQGWPRVHLRLAAGLMAVPTLLFAGFGLWFGLALWEPVLGLGGLAVLWVLAFRRDPRPRAVVAATAVQMALVLGVTYPSLGVNALPDDLPADLADHPVAVWHRPQPAMLSMHVGRSVVHLDPEDPERLSRRFDRLRGTGAYVFVHSTDLDAFHAAAEAEGLAPEPLGRFRSFYARSQFLKFYRQGTTGEEWRAALAERDPNPIQPEFAWFRLGS